MGICVLQKQTSASPSLELGNGSKSQIFLFFTAILGEDEPILTNIFSNSVVQPPTSYLLMGVWPFDDCIFLGGFV